MALGVTVLKRLRRPWGGGYGIKDLLIEVTGESSYATNGSAITAAQLGVNSILAIRPMTTYGTAISATSRKYIWNRTTGMLIAQVIGSGAQESAAANCSTDKVVCRVYAR